MRASSSHHNPLDLVLCEPLLGAVVELGGAWLSCAAIDCAYSSVPLLARYAVIPGRPETVVVDRRRDAGGERALAPPSRRRKAREFNPPRRTRSAVGLVLLGSFAALGALLFAKLHQKGE
jgi:hypothetical protein